MGASSSTLSLHLRLPLHSWRVITTLAYLLGCWAARALCTGCSSDSPHCSNDCLVQLPSSVHHHRPNIGRCDAEVTSHLHCAITARIGVQFALPHCATPSRHQHIGAVNLATPLQRPASPNGRRAALSSTIPPHCYLVHSLSIPSARSAVGFTPFPPACEPAWRKSHFPPGLPCMATGSASETFATLWGGGEKGWASKPNDVERLHAPATRQWAQD